VFGILFLAMVGVTVKLSCAVFGATASLVALLAVYGTSSARPALDRRTWLWVFGAGAGVLLIWMVRGVITSGYPVYPSVLCGFPVDWRMPEYLATRNARSLYAWGRVQDITVPVDQVLTTWTWLWPWFNEMLRCRFTVTLPLLLAAAGAPLLLFVFRSRAERRSQPSLSWRFLLVPAASLAYWFFTSPQPRFAQASFWTLGMGTFALALRRMERTKALAVVATLTLALFALNVDVFEFLRQWRKDTGPVRRGKVMPARTETGLTVYVPEEGDCWDAPLPATTSRAQLHPWLRLRVPGDLSKGFRIDQPADR
jgi:hypothetical protein